MADLVAKLEVSGRRICVLAGPGDRRDEDLREMARIAGTTFDHLILRRDDDPRGRAPDEVPRILEAELLRTGFPAAGITVIPDEQQAIEAGLRMARQGDLLLVFADAISRSWKQIIYWKSDHSDSGRGRARFELRAPAAGARRTPRGEAPAAGADRGRGLRGRGGHP